MKESKINVYCWRGKSENQEVTSFMSNKRLTTIKFVMKGSFQMEAEVNWSQ